MSERSREAIGEEIKSHVPLVPEQAPTIGLEVAGNAFTRNFSIAETYKHLFNINGPRQLGYDKLIWRAATPQRNRNDFIFNNTSGSNQNLIASPMEWVRSFGNNGNMEKMACKSRTENSWKRLELGWVKININGSMSISKQSAAVGGALRGPSERWLVGFEMVIHMTNIFQIEARAILEGLKLSWKRCFRQWCNRERQVKLQHVLRESNKVAGCLAKTTGGGMNQLVVLVDPPSHVRRLLEENIDNL
ncbi:hypothetical protein Golob_017984, partial [Gossypium lobatum]|nr:hypothetical protein [Gossypium lobatum]